LVENRCLNLPHLYLAPLLGGVTPLEFRQNFWRQKTRDLGYRIPLFAWTCV